MIGLTVKQAELLSFITKRLHATGVPPSFDEMAFALGLKSKSGIHRLIKALEERGRIVRLHNRARAISLPLDSSSPFGVSFLLTFDEHRFALWAAQREGKSLGEYAKAALLARASYARSEAQRAPIVIQGVRL